MSDGFRQERNDTDKIMKAQHTLGPWTIADTGAEELTVVSEIANSDVAYLPGWTDEGRSECQANAHLIAASPDLLEACKAAASAFGIYALSNSQKGTPDGDRKSKENARLEQQCLSAIAKATEA